MLYFPTLVQASAGAIGSALDGTAVHVPEKIESVKSGMFYRV